MRAPPDAVHRQGARRLHPEQAAAITGLSKIARVVDVLREAAAGAGAATTQIADTIGEALEPARRLVVIEAEHLCMTMRGVKKPGAVTVTSAVRGIFRTDARHAPRR